MSKIKLATVWLDGCSGCHMSLLDIDEGIVAVAKKADIVYGPLVDAQEFPEGVDVALVEGAVSSQEDMKMIQLIRKRSKMVVALGDCAVTSNVPSMRNSVPVKKLLERIYVEGVQANPGVPTEGVPPLLKHAIPLHEAVKIDLHIPGCPPKADAIFYVISELLAGRKPDLMNKVKFG
jgi:NAD-reducing hydrogenase small subunit